MPNDINNPKQIEIIPGSSGYESGSLQKAITQNPAYSSEGLSTDLTSVGFIMIAIGALILGFVAVINMFIPKKTKAELAKLRNARRKKSN
ncbi:hypothetical protein [Paralysiella testudinis]|uniref:Uncharacterized protein n=1 Tax=Paralysiella testudinis TaxID=2809020 RepID=A0A892ZJ81_9NEIS|nr:hypothetical protein [Paralysiella testudinis]QRQ82530.1 hypothetical protein JQU52_03785 [Paralysiella testudinis]